MQRDKMSLLKNFYSDPYMQLRSTACIFLIGLSLSLILYCYHSPGFYQLHFALWPLALIPLAVYAGGISTICVHNATHNNFPWHWLNESCGHIAGTH